MYWAKLHFYSGLKGFGLNEIMRSVRSAYSASYTELTTGVLNRILSQLILKHPPPFKGRFRPKLKYAHHGGKNPPVIVIHGSGLSNVSRDYIKYLEKGFRQECNLFGTPLRIIMRNSINPYMKAK